MADSELVICPVCGGKMEIYKVDGDPKTYKVRRELNSFYEAEIEEETIDKCVFYECKDCKSILKDLSIRKLILLKRQIL